MVVLGCHVRLLLGCFRGRCTDDPGLIGTTHCVSTRVEVYMTEADQGLDHQVFLQEPSQIVRNQDSTLRIPPPDTQDFNPKMEKLGPTEMPILEAQQVDIGSSPPKQPQPGKASVVSKRLLVFTGSPAAQA